MEIDVFLRWHGIALILLGAALAWDTPALWPIGLGMAIVGVLL